MTLFRINAGKYRHIITFQKMINEKNSYGEIAKNDDANWEDVLTVKAGIFPVSGKDILTDDVIKGEITHKIHTRYIKGISSEMRIKFGDRIFDLVTPPINFQEKNIEIQFLCKEKESPQLGVI